DLLRRFPYPPSPDVEPPELQEPHWRSELVALLRQDDVLTDEEHRRQIREAIAQPDWLHDLACRQRVGQLLESGDWRSPQAGILRCRGHTLQAVTWKQNPGYRQQMRAWLRAQDWGPLMGELLGFLQMLETAPSIALLAHPDQQGAGNDQPEGGQARESAT